MPLRTATLDELTIDDEGSFAHVGLYRRLKEVLRGAGYRFRLPAPGSHASWDRALFLNLTFWSGDEGSDVLCDDHIPADVVAHVAWHHVVNRRLATVAPRSAGALLFGETIASAFDLYLVGRLLPDAPDSDFIASQVPIMSEAAQQAGLSEAAFTALLDDVAAAPERAFEDMRALLFDAATALCTCQDATSAQRVLERFVGHRFEPLLHHYQLSNWILYGRVYGSPTVALEDVVHRADAALRQAPVALDWLAEHWLD